MEQFAGKVAVVTGAGSGMGRAYAERFAAEGMKVVAADVEQQALDTVVGGLREQGHDVLGVSVDVSSRDSMQALADATLAQYGAVHLVINNAGVEGYLDGPIWEATDKDWAWTGGVNFAGVLYGVQVFLPLLLRQEEETHLVNTASMTAVVQAGNMYAVTKHAVLALTETIYSELRDRQAAVGVSVLLPGIIATNLFHGIRNRPDGSPSERGKEIRDRMHNFLSDGMPPSEVADILVGAIRRKQLYVMTDHDWDERIHQRIENIVNGTNPAPPQR